MGRRGGARSNRPARDIMAPEARRTVLSNPLATQSARMWIAALALIGLAGSLAGCGGGTPSTPPQAATQATAPAAVADEPLPPPAFETGLPEAVRSQLGKPFTGDLDGMVARRMIRVGATFNRTFYFVDNGVQRGVAYEFGRAFEDELNKKLKTGNARINVVFVPLPRDLLARALMEGKVDLVVAQVTVRPELQALVDFTNPTRTNVSEVVVTGPGAPAIGSEDDLSGRDVYARKDSKYYDEPGRPEREAESQGHVAGRHPGDPRQPRRRRRARDGQRGPHPDHGRRRLHGGVLEAGLHEPHRPHRGGPPHGRESRRAHPKGQPEARRRAQRVPGEIRPRDGVRQHGGEAVSREHEVREAGHLRSASARSSWPWSITSRSTAASTSWTTC